MSEFADDFNEVITDLLQRWSLTTSADNQANGDLGVLTALERELYNWSIESLGTMIFGRRLGCVPTQHDLNLAINSDSSQQPLEKMHDFVECVQQIFIESARMTMIPPKVAHKMNLPVWRRFTSAAGKALALGK